MGEGAEFGRVEASQEEKAVVVRGRGAEDSGGDAVSFSFLFFLHCHLVFHLMLRVRQLHLFA